jgi:hypothetical protein
MRPIDLGPSAKSGLYAETEAVNRNLLGQRVSNDLAPNLA